MRELLVVLVLTMGCSGAPSTRSTSAALSDCSVPGAVPGDGLDDRAAIQAALNSGCATLGVGTYDILTPLSPPSGRRPYQILAVANSTLSGTGPDTVLRFSGDAGGLDWWGVLLGSNGVIQDITLDTSALTGTSEQTHAVRVSGPAQSPTIARATFNHPQRGLPGGDCVQVVGYPGTEVVGMRVQGVAFTHCDRSGVAVHSGAHDLQILDSSFPDTGDVHINFEGSGDTDQVLISGDTFGLSPTAQSDFAVELDLVTNARITDSTFTGSGIYVFDSDDIEVDHVQVTRTLPGTPAAVVEISKGSERLNLHDAELERAVSAAPGPVFRATPHGTGTPGTLAVSGTSLVQRTSSSVVQTAGVVGLTLTNDTIDYHGVSGQFFGVDSTGSTTIRTDQISIGGCSFTGPVLAEVRVSGSYAGTGSLAVAQSTGTGAAQGVRCENATSGARVLGPVTLTGSSPWPPNACGPPGFLVVQ